MPYTLKVEGMEDITEMLSQAGEAATDVAAQALYKGAGVVADEISKRARGIKTAPFRYAKGWQRDPSPEEKEAVVSAGAMGISKFRRTGNEVKTSVGYGKSGYADVAGRRKPVPLLAASINHGTSFMRKQPFIREAEAKARGKASEAITEEVERLIEDMMK